MENIIACRLNLNPNPNLNRCSVPTRCSAGPARTGRNIPNPAGKSVTARLNQKCHHLCTVMSPFSAMRIFFSRIHTHLRFPLLDLVPFCSVTTDVRRWLTDEPPRGHLSSCKSKTRQNETIYNFEKTDSLASNYLRRSCPDMSHFSVIFLRPFVSRFARPSIRRKPEFSGIPIRSPEIASTKNRYIRRSSPAHLLTRSFNHLTI